MLTRILVPLDGSACADHAFAHALSLARGDGAQVDVYAVVDPRAIVGRNLAVPMEEPHVAAAMSAAERCVTEAVAKAIEAGLHANGRAELGEPSAAIIRRAAETKADAIVMGAHGRSGFKRLFVGSVTQDVLRSAACPVAVIRERAVLGSEPKAPAIMRDDEAVFVLRLVEVAPMDFERLYGEIATFMDGAGKELSGALETELFGSTDRRRIEILAKFRSRGDWVRAQWDRRLGDLLEEIAATSQTLEFNLYHGDRFSSKASPEPRMHS